MNLLDAADAIQALARGDDSVEAEVGALLVADFLIASTPRDRSGKPTKGRR